MGKRCRFVQPEVVRLFFVDVHKRAYQQLLDATDPKATPEALAAAEAKITEAEEDAHYIDIKKQITAGEQRLMFAGMMRDMTPGEKVVLDPKQVGRTKVSAYLIGWSLTDAEERPVPVSDSAIDNLDPETYAEIVESIDAHEAALDAEREAYRAKNHTGATGSKAISASVAP